MPVFIASGEHVKALLSRNADLADNLHVTIGSSAFDPVEMWTDGDLNEYYGYMTTADVLVGYSFPTENISIYAPDLRMIHLISAGIDHLAPFSWAPPDVKLINNSGVHKQKVGESALMLLLMLNSRMPRLVTMQREGKWKQLFTTLIAGKTLTVFGVGNLGGAIAMQAKALGLTVIGVGPNIKNHPYCDDFLSLSDMKDAFSRSDFLAVTAPLTSETKGIISERALSWLPPHAGFLNISRGGLVDNKALDRKLRDGELDCAILDVTDPEPLPPGHYLWETPNLIITPHVMGDDSINYMPLTLDLTISNVRRMLNGEALLNVVDTADKRRYTMFRVR